MPRKKAALEPPASVMDTPQWPAANVEMRDINELSGYPRNSRTHTPAQITQIAASMTAYGFTDPLLVDESGTILAGHARLAAAKELGFAEVPVVTATGWSDDQKRSFVIAHNRIAMNASWDEELLAMELGDCGDWIGLTGFTQAEIDKLLVKDSSSDSGDGTAAEVCPTCGKPMG